MEKMETEVAWAEKAAEARATAEAARAEAAKDQWLGKLDDTLGDKLGEPAVPGVSAEEVELWASQAQAQREGVEEAAELARDVFQVALGAASKGVDAVLSGQAANWTTSDADVAGIAARAKKVGVALQGAASAALETTRADFESYEKLREAGQLPTLLEEAGVPDDLPERVAKVSSKALAAPLGPSPDLLRPDLTPSLVFSRLLR